MSRSRGKVAAHARHKKVIRAARGYRGRRKNTFKTARAATIRAGQYAYVGRKVKKRSFRSLWVQRINAAVREHDSDMTYSRFIAGLKQAGIEIDRKMLAELAIRKPDAFKAGLKAARDALS